MILRVMKTTFTTVGGALGPTAALVVTTDVNGGPGSDSVVRSVSANPNSQFAGMAVAQLKISQPPIIKQEISIIEYVLK